MLKRHVAHVLVAGICGVILCSGGVFAAGEPDESSRGEIVVTADRFPTGEKESARFVTVYSSEELMETGAENLVQALRRKGGFSYKSFGSLGVSHGGMNSEITSRGIKKGTLILVNGCTVQSASGQGYDLDMIPIEQIERVEVMKGAASTLYGADAMAGVVNIITKKSTASAPSVVAVEAGSHGYRTANASVSSARVNVGVSYSHLDDVDKLSESTGESAKKRYTYARDDVDNVGLNFNATLVDGLFVDYMGSFSETGYAKIMDTGVLAKETEQEHAKHFVDIRLERENSKVKAFVYYDVMERDEVAGTKTTHDKNKNYNSGLQGDHRFNLGSVEMTTGADYVYRGADYNNKYGKHYRNDYSIFLQAKKTFFDSVTAVVGCREQVIDNETSDMDYDIFLPSAGLNVKVSQGLNLFANAGKAFRAPTFNDLYYQGDVLTGNPDLDPESGWSYEGGAKYDNTYMKVRLAVFFMKYEDKIETKGRGDNATKFNAGNYESKGVEWETAFYPFASMDSLLEAVSLDVAGYWADATADDAKGEEYQAAPKFQTSVGLSYLTDDLVLNLNTDILRERDCNLPSYNPVNFAGKVKCLQGYLTFGVDNMFDETVVTYGQNTEGLSSQYAYYDLGLTYKLGYEMRF